MNFVSKSYDEGFFYLIINIFYIVELVGKISSAYFNRYNEYMSTTWHCILHLMCLQITYVLYKNMVMGESKFYMSWEYIYYIIRLAHLYKKQNNWSGLSCFLFKYDEIIHFLIYFEILLGVSCWSVSLWVNRKFIKGFEIK